MEQLNGTALLLAATIAAAALSVGKDADVKIYRDAGGLCQGQMDAPDATGIELKIRSNHLVWVSCSAPGKL